MFIEVCGTYPSAMPKTESFPDTHSHSQSHCVVLSHVRDLAPDLSLGLRLNRAQDPSGWEQESTNRTKIGAMKAEPRSALQLIASRLHYAAVTVVKKSSIPNSCGWGFIDIDTLTSYSANDLWRAHKHLQMTVLLLLVDRFCLYPRTLTSTHFGGLFGFTAPGLPHQLIWRALSLLGPQAHQAHKWRARPNESPLVPSSKLEN